MLLLLPFFLAVAFCPMYLLFLGFTLKLLMAVSFLGSTGRIVGDEALSWV